MENFGGMIELLQNWTLVMTSHPTIHFPKKKSSNCTFTWKTCMIHKLSLNKVVKNLSAAQFHFNWGNVHLPHRSWETCLLNNNKNQSNYWQSEQRGLEKFSDAAIIYLTWYLPTKPFLTWYLPTKPPTTIFDVKTLVKLDLRNTRTHVFLHILGIPRSGDSATAKSKIHESRR